MVLALVLDMCYSGGMDDLARMRLQRQRAMRGLRNLGWTLASIGNLYGLKRQRVHQLLGASYSSLVSRGAALPRPPAKG